MGAAIFILKVSRITEITCVIHVRLVVISVNFLAISVIPGDFGNIRDTVIFPLL